MKIFGLKLLRSVSWDVGSGCVAGKVQNSHENFRIEVCSAWYNMESCSGKVQKRDVWDKNLRVWGFVVYLWDVGSGLAHMRGVTWRAVPAKFKTGMCEIKILGSEILWCVFRAHMRGAICSGKVQNRDVWDENFWVEICSVSWVGSGLAHMRGVIQWSWDVGSGWVGSHVVLWRGKVHTGMCEIKILGSEVLWCVFATLVQGWHRCVVSSVPSCSGRVQNRDVWDENLRVWGFVVCHCNIGSGLAHAWCHLFRVVPAKSGMCEIKILGSEVLWCILQVQGVWDENFRIPAKFQRGM